MKKGINTHNSYRNMIAQLVINAFLDLEDNNPQIKQDAIHFFETGNYIPYARILQIEPNAIFQKYEGIMDQTPNTTPQSLSNAPIPVIQLTLRGMQINSFKSIQEAAEKTGVCRLSISNCISGQKQTTKGYRWERAQEANE